MKKKIIRLTENDIHQIINSSVSDVLNEQDYSIYDFIEVNDPLGCEDAEKAAMEDMKKEYLADKEKNKPNSDYEFNGVFTDKGDELRFNDALKRVTVGANKPRKYPKTDRESVNRAAYLSTNDARGFRKLDSEAKRKYEENFPNLTTKFGEN